MVEVHKLVVLLGQAFGGLVTKKLSDSERFLTWCITPVTAQRNTGYKTVLRFLEVKMFAHFFLTRLIKNMHVHDMQVVTFSSKIHTEHARQLLHEDLSHLQRTNYNLQVLTR